MGTTIQLWDFGEWHTMVAQTQNRQMAQYSLTYWLDAVLVMVLVHNFMNIYINVRTAR